MPPTTGGSTIGSVVRPRSSALPRNSTRASNQASGNPKTSASAVVASEAISVSHSASRDAGLVITLVIVDQGARITNPVSGRMKNSAEIAARLATTGLNACLDPSTVTSRPG